MEINELKPIIDALIFASESPLPTTRIKQIFDETNPDEIAAKDIKAAITELNSDNREQTKGLFPAGGCRRISVSNKTELCFMGKKD